MSKNVLTESGDDEVKSGWMAAGGIVGAILASSCCILHLLFLSMGVGGAWMGNLTATVTYDPDKVELAQMTEATTNAGFPSIVRESSGGD